MPPTSPPARAVEKFAGRLRFPVLFFLTAGLFVADVLLPDVVPLVDEILLGLATVLFASWRRRKDEGAKAANVETSATEK